MAIPGMPPIGEAAVKAKAGIGNFAQGAVLARNMVGGGDSNKSGTGQENKESLGEGLLKGVGSAVSAGSGLLRGGADILRGAHDGVMRHFDENAAVYMIVAGVIKYLIDLKVGSVEFALRSDFVLGVIFSFSFGLLAFLPLLLSIFLWLYSTYVSQSTNVIPFFAFVGLYVFFKSKQEGGQHLNFLSRAMIIVIIILLIPFIPALASQLNFSADSEIKTLSEEDWFTVPFEWYGESVSNTVGDSLDAVRCLLGNQELCEKTSELFDPSPKIGGGVDKEDYMDLSLRIDADTINREYRYDQSFSFRAYLDVDLKTPLTGDLLCQVGDVPGRVIPDTFNTQVMVMPDGSARNVLDEELFTCYADLSDISDTGSYDVVFLVNFQHEIGSTLDLYYIDGNHSKGRNLKDPKQFPPELTDNSKSSSDHTPIIFRMEIGSEPIEVYDDPEMSTYGFWMQLTKAPMIDGKIKSILGGAVILPTGMKFSENCRLFQQSAENPKQYSLTSEAWLDMNRQISSNKIDPMPTLSCSIVVDKSILEGDKYKNQRIIAKIRYLYEMKRKKDTMVIGSGATA